MLKKRFTNLFDLQKKNKDFKFMLGVILLLGTSLLCISCTQSTDSKTDNIITYENEILGFSMEFPTEWKDRYIVEELEDGIDVFSKKNINEGGLLFSIRRLIGELITEEDMGQAPVNQQIILQGNGYTYFDRMVSDIQYPLDNEELSKEYKSMSEQVSKITKSISILGNQEPKALNEGFKVVGTSFFTVEIPSYCDMKIFEDSMLSWNLYKGNNKIGYIDMIPYKTIGTDEEYVEDEQNIIYITNEEILRKARVQLFTDDLNQATMEKIRDSFIFTGGPYNVVDLKTNAGIYLEKGGKKIFGMIEDFEMENGIPVAVRIKVMEFITDGEDPNGFHIEDLDRTERYLLDFGVQVAPLVAPQYNNYGIYEMPLIDELFIKNYEDFKNYYYNFIIGSDGQLKIVLGFYTP